MTRAKIWTIDGLRITERGDLHEGVIYTMDGSLYAAPSTIEAMATAVRVGKAPALTVCFGKTKYKNGIKYMPVEYFNKKPEPASAPTTRRRLDL